MKVGHVIGLLLLTILYGVLVAPVALIFALTRTDSLGQKVGARFHDKTLRTDPDDYKRLS